METIFALASGALRAGVAVVRVSGPAAAETFRRLAGREVPPPRQATLATLKDGAVPLDRALCLYFPGPASFTGEDVVEYHLHGGRAVIEGVLAALSCVEGCRMAEPGEFTRRAFENGKLDLTAAEGLADLIAAETEAQRLQAFAQMEGVLFALYAGWAESLKNILAHQEAEIEFPDEDMPGGVAESLKPQIRALHAAVEAHLNDGRRGERLRDGILIAIIGAPNAGKSSLLNAALGRDAAIVSEEAGTTRDVIEAHLDLNGLPVILADTAGLRATGNKTEAEGVRRAGNVAARADLKIALFDGTVARDAETLAHVDEKTVVACNKSDLPGYSCPPGALAVSAQTGAGLDALLKILGERAAALLGEGRGPALTRSRHREALRETAEALLRCLEAALPELAAEDLRLALRALGRITGRVHVEQVLDAVFRDFCIGK